jgi:GntR family transcriptional regulator/MocR family aminotransferase
MRRLYAWRQKALIDAIDAHLGGLLEAMPADAGMHLIARLDPALARRMDDAEASARAAKAGIAAPALSSYSRLPDPPQGLVLGYAGFDERAMDAAARKLALALGRVRTAS